MARITMRQAWAVLSEAAAGKFVDNSEFKAALRLAIRILRETQKFRDKMLDLDDEASAHVLQDAHGLFGAVSQQEQQNAENKIEE